jgi:hypothetical protein
MRLLVVVADQDRVGEVTTLLDGAGVTGCCRPD